MQEGWCPQRSPQFESSVFRRLNSNFFYWHEYCSPKITCVLNIVFWKRLEKMDLCGQLSASWTCRSLNTGHWCQSWQLQELVNNQNFWLQCLSADGIKNRNTPPTHKFLEDLQILTKFSWDTVKANIILFLTECINAITWWSATSYCFSVVMKK